MYDIIEVYKRFLTGVIVVLTGLAAYYIYVLFYEIGQVLTEHDIDIPNITLPVVEIVLLVANFILIHICNLGIHCRQDAESKLIGHRVKYSFGAIMPCIAFYFLCIVSVVLINVFGANFMFHAIVMGVSLVSIMYTVLCVYYNRKLYLTAYRAYLTLYDEEGGD